MLFAVTADIGGDMISRIRTEGRASFSIMLFTAAVLGMSSAKAEVVLGPATYSIQFESVPGAVNASGASPQSGGPYTFLGGTLDVNAAAATTAQPAASASVVSGGCTSGFPGSGCAGGSYSVVSKIDYNIEVTGPANVMVPYFFDTAGGLTIVGSGSAQAKVDLVAPGGIGLKGFDASTLWTGTSTVCGTNGCVDGTQLVQMLTNTQYAVEILASVGAGTNIPGSISAWADPHIYIDPTFAGADQFTLLISDGVGNSIASPVPGPTVGAGASSFVLAALFLGWFVRRRAHQLV
jgi:hypothetical protein